LSVLSAVHGLSGGTKPEAGFERAAWKSRGIPDRGGSESCGVDEADLSTVPYGPRLPPSTCAEL
ncbi:MAG TPA: hypothetical protein PLM33_14640, partial [Acidobacteriota bacterium]|nr:hypothetical protein [Acidobacteriota bacterium]